MNCEKLVGRRFGVRGAAGWRQTVKDRWALAVAAALSTVTLYAEGVLKNGLIEIGLLAPVVWFLATPAKSRLLQNILLSLTAVCLTAAISDLLLRPVMAGRLHFSPTEMLTRKLPHLPIVGRWDPGVMLTGEAYGDLAAMSADDAAREPRLVTVTTDAAGFRNAAIDQPIKLVVLGDSFGAGSGTTQEQTMPHLLQTRYELPTYNLSFPASGPWQQYINLAIESPRLHFAPHAVLLWMLYTGNDLEDEYGDAWAIEDLPWRSHFRATVVSYKTFLGRSPINQLVTNVMWRFRNRRQPAGLISKRYLPDGRPVLFLNVQERWSELAQPDVERHPNFPKLVQTMQHMKRLTEGLGLRTVVLILPTKGEVYPWILKGANKPSGEPRASGFSRAVLTACRRLGLSCLDVKPYFMQEADRIWASKGELLWWRDDTHLNGHGHEVLAKFVARHVLAMPDSPVL